MTPKVAHNAAGFAISRFTHYRECFPDHSHGFWALWALQDTCKHFASDNCVTTEIERYYIDLGDPEETTLIYNIERRKFIVAAVDPWGGNDSAFEGNYSTL